LIKIFKLKADESQVINPESQTFLKPTYNLVNFEKALETLHSRYLDAFDQHHELLQIEAMK